MTTIITSIIFVVISLVSIFAGILLVSFIFGKKNEIAAQNASEKEAAEATKAIFEFDIQRFSEDFELDLCYDQAFLFQSVDITEVMEHGLGFKARFSDNDREMVAEVLKGMHKYIICANKVRIELEKAMGKKIAHWPENSLAQAVFESEEECDKAEEILKSLELEYQRF